MLGADQEIGQARFPSRSPCLAGTLIAPVRPSAVAITRTSQPASGASWTNSFTLAAAGAPRTITYKTPGDLACALINGERSSPGASSRLLPGSLFWDVSALGGLDEANLAG